MRHRLSIDLDEYLSTLPAPEVTEPTLQPPKRYQVSYGPLLKQFNGFTGEERRRGGQLGLWLLKAGCITLPAQCDICGSSGPLNLHGENYYAPASDPALCRPCHRALHLRPWNWNAWRRIVDEAAVTGREWFALAPPNGVDLARHLREQIGPEVIDIEASPLLPLPEAVIALLPSNMLPHADILQRQGSLDLLKEYCGAERPTGTLHKKCPNERCS